MDWRFESAMNRSSGFQPQASPPQSDAEAGVENALCDSWLPVGSHSGNGSSRASVRHAIALTQADGKAILNGVKHMEINAITDLAQFDSLKDAWESAYAADRHATICVSWPWLRGWFEVTPHSWLVLALRPDSDSPYVGFLPLAMKDRHLYMGGSPLADYTGFVCVPEYEKKALRAWARYVAKKLPWRMFHWTNSMDPRQEVFLGHFARSRFLKRQVQTNTCPYIELPATWDEYLNGRLGPKTSRDMRRSMKKIEESPDYHITHATTETLDTHLETLLTEWQARWGLPDYYRSGFKRVLQRTHLAGLLWLGIMWDGSKPISALAGFIERDRKTFTACLTTSDRSYSQLRPGKTLYACGIQYAIEQGCEVFDFTQGNEDYKFSFGAVERPSPNYTVARMTFWMSLKELRNQLESWPLIGRFARLTHLSLWKK